MFQLIHFKYMYCQKLSKARFVPSHTGEQTCWSVMETLFTSELGAISWLFYKTLASKKASSHIAPLVMTSLPYNIHQKYIKVVYTLSSAPTSSLAIGGYQPKCSPRVPCRLTTIYSKEKRAVWRPWEDHIETYQRVLATLKIIIIIIIYRFVERYYSFKMF